MRDAKQMLLAIKVIAPNKPCQKVEPDAWVETDRLLFYIATGVGKVTLGGQAVMVISPVSPIGKVFHAKTKR